MKKIIVLVSLMLMSVTSLASQTNINEMCFSLSLDGKKISHIVIYEYDWDNQIAGEPPPTIDVRVFNYQNAAIIFGSIIDQNITERWVGRYVYPGPERYSGSHHLVFSESDAQGKKTNYEIKLVGLAQDIGDGITILRGQSEVKIDGKAVLFPNLKTIRSCPNPSDLKEIKEVESLL
ncbi:hypothetical protein D3C87_190470 [compost metagenome]